MHCRVVLMTCTRFLYMSDGPQIFECECEHSCESINLRLSGIVSHVTVRANENWQKVGKIVFIHQILQSFPIQSSLLEVKNKF